ncbi:helicase associated domain-containing protein [Streptomyces sp. NPDC002659]|uniref:helicase associated domain-containing protein n=1 Tax=Streptomyces sp. NPDC002659 TaxID=3364656 RepID=UPI0036B64A38
MAGQMTGRRAERLEMLGMAWDAADAAFGENLAAARVYFEKHWTLCTPRAATALDGPVGQWLSKPAAAGRAGRPPGAGQGASAAIDEHWNPHWQVEWQRHYAAVRELLVEESTLAYVEPGVTVHGMDVGK